jgi:transcriptional regulator with XRE-family HTH domain
VYTASRINLHPGILPGMPTQRPTPPSSRPAPISVALGKRVKQCRHAADKSQETLAFEAHVDRTYISSIERGIANPSVETLANICYALDVTLGELFAPLDRVSLKPTGTRRANAATPPEIKRSRLR